MAEPVYRPVNAVVLALYRTLGWKLDVQGSEHLPARGGALLAANHVGYLDFTFVGYGAKQRRRLVRFMAKKEVFDHRISGPLMRGMKHLPVDRYGKPVDALQTGIAALRAGELVGMFPEGTISVSFVPARAKTGAARMAMGAGVPLVPVAVWGSQRIMTKGRPRNFRRGVAITIRFGAPIAYEEGEDAGVVTRRLMDAIETMVDEVARAYPQRPAGEDDRWWLPAYLGGSAPSVEESKADAERQAADRRALRRAERTRERQTEIASGDAGDRKRTIGEPPGQSGGSV